MFQLSVQIGQVGFRIITGSLCGVLPETECPVCLLDLVTRRYDNAGSDPVSASEALLSSVAKQAVTFCSDRDGDGVIELKEGCLAVRTC